MNNKTNRLYLRIAPHLATDIKDYKYMNSSVKQSSYMCVAIDLALADKSITKKTHDTLLKMIHDALGGTGENVVRWLIKNKHISAKTDPNKIQAYRHDWLADLCAQLEPGK